jgi:hypothetical protein
MNQVSNFLTLHELALPARVMLMLMLLCLMQHQIHLNMLLPPSGCHNERSESMSLRLLQGAVPMCVREVQTLAPAVRRCAVYIARELNLSSHARSSLRRQQCTIASWRIGVCS